MLALRGGRLTEYDRIMAELRSGDTTPGGRLDVLLNDIPLKSFIRGPRAEDATRLENAVRAAPLHMLPVADRRYIDIASAYALTGRPDKARAMLARYTAEMKDTALVRSEQIEFQRALALAMVFENKWLEAAETFRRSDHLADGPADPCAVCLSIVLARTLDAAGMVDSAVVYYDRAVNQHDLGRLEGSLDAATLAPFSRRLGELYEQTGKPQLALRYYQHFVNLWAKADPEFQPQVTETRRRIARLKGLGLKPTG